MFVVYLHDYFLCSFIYIPSCDATIELTLSDQYLVTRNSVCGGHLTRNQSYTGTFFGYWILPIQLIEITL